MGLKWNKPKPCMRNPDMFNADGTLRIGFGYKLFFENSDGMLTTLHEGTYRVGGTYEIGGVIGVRRHGYHYCLHPKYCYLYFAEKLSVMHIIEILGVTKYESGQGGIKYCTDRYRIVEKADGVYKYITSDKVVRSITFRNGVVQGGCSGFMPGHGHFREPLALGSEKQLINSGSVSHKKK